MERRGEKTEIGDINRQAQQERRQSADDRQTLADINVQETELQTSLEAAQKERDRLTQEQAKPAPPDLAKLPIKEQEKVFDAIRDKLAASRQEKALRVRKNHSTGCSGGGRQRWPGKSRRTSGMLAAFKRGAYEQAKTVWEKAHHQAGKLAAQANGLHAKLMNAARDCKRWAHDKLTRDEPELTRRVQAHKQQERKRQVEQQRKQQEKSRDNGHGR